MIQTTEEFNTIVNQESRTFRARFLKAGEVLDCEIKSITIYKGACGNEFSIGSIFMPYIDAEIMGCSQALENQELTLEIGLLLGYDDAGNERIEFIPMGGYTVTEPKVTTDLVSFTAVGQISTKFGSLYTSKLVYPATVQAVAAEISSQTGVPIIFRGLTSTGKITKKPTGLLHREMLSYLAGVLGGFATEDNQGNIVISKFSTSDPVLINGDRSIDPPEFKDYDYTLSGIRVVVTEAGEDEEGNILSGESYTYGVPKLYVSNPYMTKTLFSELVINVIGYSWRPGSVSLALGDPRLEPWDCLSVTDIDGKSYTVPCLELTHKFDGGLITEIEAAGTGDKEGESKTKGPLSSQLDRISATLFTAQEAILKRLKADEADLLYAKVGALEAVKANVTKLEAHQITVEYLNANYATLEQLSAVNLEVETLAANQITTKYLATNYAQIDLANIKDGCITTAMIGKGVVDTAQIKDGSITDAKIVTLTANKITAGKIDAAEIEVINLNCANLTVGSINGQQIAPGAIDLTKLSTELNKMLTATAEEVQDALKNAGLAAESASSAQTTADGKNTVFYQTSAPVATGRKVNDVWFDTDDGNKMYYWSGTAWTAKQFSTSAIATNAITATLISSGAITAVKLATNAVTADKIYAGAVTVDKIAAGAVDTDKLKANAVTAAKIAVGTITAGCMAANSITAEKISASAITAAKIATSAITSDKIVADAITTAKIAAGAITSNEIAANAITTVKIKAGAITADKIDVKDLFAQEITATGKIIGGIVQSAGFAISNVKYDQDGKIISGTVKDGSRIDLVSGSFETPQITIKKDYISVTGSMKVGFGNTCDTIGSFVSGSGNSIPEGKSVYSSIVASCASEMTGGAWHCGIFASMDAYISNDGHTLTAGTIEGTSPKLSAMVAADNSWIDCTYACLIAGAGNSIVQYAGACCIAGGFGNTIIGTEATSSEDEGLYNAFIGGGEGLQAKTSNVAVFGKYNDPVADRKPLLIVGNGGDSYTDTSLGFPELKLIRKNAFEVDEDGSVFIGGLPAHDAIKKVADMGKVLWSGAWSSGTITVPNTASYQTYLIKLSDGSAVLGIKNPAGTILTGLGGYSYNTPSIVTAAINIGISGNRWSYKQPNLKTAHYPAGSHGAKTTFNIVEIVGFI